MSHAEPAMRSELGAERWRRIEDILDAALVRPPSIGARCSTRSVGTTRRCAGKSNHCFPSGKGGELSRRAARRRGGGGDSRHRRAPPCPSRRSRGAASARTACCASSDAVAWACVFLAERDDGEFRRRVAVKVLRDGPDAEEVHAVSGRATDPRLALITRTSRSLLDGGVGRRPAPVPRHRVRRRGYRSRILRRAPPRLEARLRLFLDVCAAAQYAHQNLVLHRDLKPRTCWSRRRAR